MLPKRKKYQPQMTFSDTFSFLLVQSNPDEDLFEAPLEQYFQFKNDNTQKEDRIEIVNDMEQSTLNQSKMQNFPKFQFDKCQLPLIQERSSSMDQNKEKIENEQKKSEKNFIEKIVPILESYLSIENNVKKKKRGTKTQLLSIIKNAKYREELAKFFSQRKGQRSSLLLNSFSPREISKGWKKIRERYLASLKQGSNQQWSSTKFSQPKLYS